MQIARETDLPDLLEHLGYQVRQIGRDHTTKEMDSPPANTIDARGFATLTRLAGMPLRFSSGSAARVSKRR